MSGSEAPLPASPKALPATEVLIGRIGWLITLRWVAVGGSLAFIEGARRLLPIHVHFSRLVAVLAVLALYNLGAVVLLHRLRRRRQEGSMRAGVPPPSRPVGRLARFLLPRTPPGVEYYDEQAAEAALLAAAQIALDLVFLALLLHFSGGVENPLRVFFIFHVIVASILLSAPATYCVATWGFLLFAALSLAELSQLLPHYSLEGHWRPDGYLDPRLVGAHVFLLGVTLYVGAYLASSIAARLRRREIDVVVLSRHLEAKAQRLEEAYQELCLAEKAKSEYMRKVAHELRGPLGTIKTALSVALSSAPHSLAPRTRGLIERAERRAGELADMTKELLALALARGGEALAHPVAVDPAEVARGVLDELAPRAAEGDIALTVEIADKLPPLRGNPGAIADLMRNLLANAVRYTPPAGSVTFRLGAEADEIVLEVADTGIGIEPNALTRIFEEFYRSETARAFAPDGTGLGLAIVKAVVDQHRGTIAVESEPGQGTRFVVRLPVEPTEEGGGPDRRS